MRAASGDLAHAATQADQAVALDTLLADQDSEKAIRTRLLSGQTLRQLGRTGDAVPPLQAALASAEAMAPQQPALVAHLAAELAAAATSSGDEATATRMRGLARASLGQVAPGRCTERDAVVRLLATR